MAVFDPTLRTVVPDIGTRPIADSRYVVEMTGVSFRPGVEAVRAAAESLIAHGLV